MTSYAVDQLIELCEKKLQAGGHSACNHGRDPEPFCMLLNEIGYCAVRDDDKSAQKYLVGLLSHSNEGAQFIALCYLLQVAGLEAGDVFILDNFKKKNSLMLQAAMRTIANQPN
ncbi:hypothetical protein KJ885_05960 [Patescibacteria group bacterium]|nr:hypothetical protein [Patescibacteria group bacterium]